MLRNLDKKKIKNYTLSYRIYENKLYADDIVGQVGEPVASGKFELDKGGSTTVDTRYDGRYPFRTG